MQEVTIERFMGLMQFKAKSQFRHLLNPTREQVVEAAREVSHHILIEGTHDFWNVMNLCGWRHFPSSILPEGYAYYCNIDYIPTDWYELWGWYNFTEYYTTIANKLKPRAKIVEVGINWGRSVAHLARMLQMHRKEPTIYAVDPFPAEPHLHATHPEPDYRRVNRNFKAMGLDEINVMPCKSVRASKHFRDETMDFVYIDGNHKYEAVKADIEHWLPKVKKHCLLSGHDYHNCAGVKQAVNELLGEKNITLHEGGVWEFQKT